MGRLEVLSIDLANKVNDSKVLGGNTSITVATQDGNRFSAARRLSAVNYAKNEIDKFSRMNIATAIQNHLSFQSPFRIADYYLSVASGTPSLPEIQQILRIEDLKTPPTKFRQVMNDVIDEYKTVGYTMRDVYPDGVFTISTTLTNNIVPSGIGFDYRAYVKSVDSISLTAFPKVKFAPVSAAVFDDVTRGVKSQASEEQLARYTGIYSASGEFSNGTFTPYNINFTPARVYETLLFRSETSPVTEFIKLPLDLLRDVQNNVYSESLFEALKSRLSFQKASGIFENGEFTPFNPNFDFKYVQEVTGMQDGFKAVQVDWQVVDDLQHGLRPTFQDAFKSAYGKYTALANIASGQLTFTDVNMSYESHVADITGIKSSPFYVKGGEKFRKVNFYELREYQNGTAVLQNPNALPDGRTDDFLFATNDTGAAFYPKNLTVSNVEVEYLGIPSSKVFGYRQGSFKHFPITPTATATGVLEYFGFSQNTVFYSESFRDEIEINVLPKNYTGDATVTYRGLPISLEFFTSDSDKIRMSGLSGEGLMTYTGKPPAFVYSFRNGKIETFPELNLRILASGVSNEYIAKAQRAHPTLVYNVQDLEYPPEFDALVLDFAAGYLYEENGDFDYAAILFNRAKQGLAEWIGVANIALGSTQSRQPKERSANGNE